MIPVASAFRVFDSEGRVADEGTEMQLRTLGAEVVRVTTRFADHVTPERARECEESAERFVAQPSREFVSQPPARVEMIRVRCRLACSRQTRQPSV